MGRRHWKQRWDPDADFVFLRRMKLGLEGLEVVLPGDPVPKDHPVIKNRLRFWWRAEIIGLADFEVGRTGRNRPLDPDLIVAFRERALAELQALDDSSVASLGAHHEGALYGLLIAGTDVGAFYVAKIPPMLPEGEAVPWEVAEEDQIPAAVLDTFDIPEDLVGDEEPDEFEEVTIVERDGKAVMTVIDDQGIVHETEFLTMEAALAHIEGDEGAPAIEPVVVPLGGGWYEVAVEGEDVARRVRGKPALEALLTEIAGA